jgi:uncharacterized SAM-binding protein YcdF (DUF218 family)
MFVIKKLITPFILPPGLFIIILIFSGALFIYFKRRKTGIFALAIGLIFWLFCSAPFSNFLMRGLESNFQITVPVKGDVIILLGGGIKENVPDLSGTGIPSDAMLGRIVTAARLQKKVNLPIIVSGGTVFENKNSEAVIARRFLVDLGVAENKILMEDKSRDTYENAKYAREICQRFDFKLPILVTSAYHLKRAKMAFDMLDMPVTPFPAFFRAEKSPNYNWRSFLPTAGSLKEVSEALHEYLGILYMNMVRFAHPA